MDRTIFITGTDTGVGKTVLTALLLAHLRATGARAIALKPFCSGGRADAELLCAMQEGELTIDEINPFYFPEPLAPLAAARLHHRSITLRQVLDHIEQVRRITVSRPQIANRKSQIADRPSCLLIEGVGGAFVPLGEGYLVADLIQRLNCPVIVVARNRLGTLNHTILTVQALRKRSKKRITVVLREEKTPDLSARWNRRILLETLAPMDVLALPFLGRRASEGEGVKINAKKVKIVLASILG